MVASNLRSVLSHRMEDYTLQVTWEAIAHSGGVQVTQDHIKNLGTDLWFGTSAPIKLTSSHVSNKSKMLHAHELSI